MDSIIYKIGWITLIEEDEIECILRKEFELDDELIISRGLLSNKQNKMVKIGAIIRYDKANEKIEFLKKDGVTWI